MVSLRLPQAQAPVPSPWGAAIQLRKFRSLPVLRIVAGSYLSLPTLFLKTKFLDSSLLAGKRESRLTAAAPATDPLSITPYALKQGGETICPAGLGSSGNAIGPSGMTLSLAHDPRTCSRSQWKSSTASSHRERTTFHVTPEFGKQAISSFSRADLQNFLDVKARKRLWYSDVSHLLRDLKQ